MTSSTPLLHYIHDPLCGWCYGAAPLVKAARAVLPVQAHGGGMMQRQPVTAQLRAYVAPHDRRIAQLSGQPFGAAYTEGLLCDTAAVLDSLPPIAAMLAAEQLGGRGLDLLARVQTAHYVQGLRIAEPAVLLQLGGELGLEPDAFAQALAQMEGAAVRAHVAQTRALMARLGLGGFPSLVLERDGQWQTLDVGAFLGQPQALADWLRTQLPQPVPGEAGAGAQTGALQCAPEGCAV